MHMRTVRAWVSAVLLVAGTAHGQQQAAPSQPQNPLDVIPEKMPFDVAYGAPIPLARAQAVIAAAQAEATKRGWKLNIVVTDSGGNLVAFVRMDGAQLASIAISEHKARVAVMFRRETKAYENAVQSGNLYTLTLDGMIASRGGIPLVEGGKICSGFTTGSTIGLTRLRSATTSGSLTARSVNCFSPAFPSTSATATA